jgi:phytoene dehydrogenase-like protein
MDKAPPNLHSFNQQKSMYMKYKYMRHYISDMKTLRFFGQNYEDIYRLMTEPAANMLDEWFESDVLKGTLATDSVIGANLSPYSSGSAYVLLHHVIGGVDGQKGAWAYVEGGMGAISQCLAHNAKCFDDQIEIFVNQKVEHIELDNSQKRATGVVLADGKFIESEYVLSNATPHVTFQKLMTKFNLENHPDEEISRFFKRVDKIDYDSGTMKINLAVNKLPNFLANPNTSETVPMPHHQTTIHINSENMQLLDKAYLDLNVEKKPSAQPMIEMVGAIKV